MKKFLSLIALLFPGLSVHSQTCFSVSNYSCGVSPLAICRADFNGDSNMDLATANQGSNDISILLGNSNGTFNPAISYTCSTSPMGIESGDFNQDGKADLAVSYPNGNNIGILPGNGNGTFGTQTFYSTGTYPQMVRAADFNNDGHLDLAVTNWYSNNVSILTGSGTGTFTNAGNYPTAANPFDIAIADYDGNGNMDLAITAPGYDSLDILLGMGNGTFSKLPSLGAMSAPLSIISGDFNNDARPDLVYGTFSGVELRLNVGSGSFGFPSTIASGAPGYWSVTTSDFNGDSNADLVTVLDSTRQVSFYLGNGNGTFSSSATYTLGLDPFAVLSHDFNSDAKPDIAVATHVAPSDIYILLSSPMYTITASANPSVICPGGSSTLNVSGASSSYAWSTGATSSSIVVTPSVTTTYTVQEKFQCSNTESLTITVVSMPQPDICMVSTDSASNYRYNVVYWNKSLYTRADSFLIYRYDVISSQYLNIGSVSKDSLSIFIDTAFSIGGPNGGNPLFSSWRYKLALKDSCGNVSAMSPYHETMFVQNNNSSFSWNAYAVESGTSPVTGYSFLRDDQNNGNWHVLVNTAGLSTTDPSYSNYPNGNWRVDALGFNCTSSLTINSKKSHSNTRQPVPNGIQETRQAATLSVYPNPCTDILHIINPGNETIVIENMMGETQMKLPPEKKREITLENLGAGVYIVRCGSATLKLIRE